MALQTVIKQRKIIFRPAVLEIMLEIPKAETESSYLFCFAVLSGNHREPL